MWSVLGSLYLTLGRLHGRLNAKDSQTKIIK